MLFYSYSYEILYEQFHWIYLQGDVKLLLFTVNNRLKFEIEIVHDLSCHPIISAIVIVGVISQNWFSVSKKVTMALLSLVQHYVALF